MKSNNEKTHYFDFNHTFQFQGHFAVLSTALELNIFEILKDDFLSVAEIKEKCGIKIRNRNLCDFLDVLLVNGHLIREGKLDTAKYKVSDHLLLKSNPFNIIPLIKMLKTIQKTYDNLSEVMRNGKFAEQCDIFQELYSDPEETETFLKSMSLIQLETFKYISKDFDYKNYKTCLDIGGCLGAFSIEMKIYNPHLNVYTFDLPVIEKYTIEFLKDKQMLDQVNVLSGDFFLDNFMKSDIIAMGNILHDWNYEKKQHLIKKAFESLNEGGVFIVVEKFIDNDRTENGIGIYHSFNMLVECLDGYNMSHEDLEQHAKEVGFIKCEFINEPNGIEVAFLRK